MSKRKNLMSKRKKEEEKEEIIEEKEEKEGIEFEDIFAQAEGQKTEYFTILNDLIDDKKNLELKTEINKPLGWASLKLIEDYLGKFGLEYSQSILKLFTKTSFKYLISKNRGSRYEIIKALTHSDIEIQKENIEIP